MNFKQLIIAILLITGTTHTQTTSYADYSSDKALSAGVFALCMAVCMKIAKDIYDEAHKQDPQKQQAETPASLWPADPFAEETSPFYQEAPVALVPEQNNELYEYLTSTC